MKITANIGTALKAIYAAGMAFLTGVGTSLIGAHTFGVITDGQWITIATFTLAAFGAVYGVTNAPKTPPPSTSAPVPSAPPAA